MVRSVDGGFWPFEYPESPWKHHSCGVFHSSPSAWLQRSRSVQPTGDFTWLWEVFIWSLEYQQHSWPSQLLWFFGSLWRLNRPPHWLERQFSRALALKLWFQSCWWFKVWPWASRLGSIWCRVHLLALVVTNKTVINLDCEHSFKFNTGFLATAFLCSLWHSLCFWRNMKQSTWPNWPSKWCRRCSWADPSPCRPEWQVCGDLPSSALTYFSI